MCHGGSPKDMGFIQDDVVAMLMLTSDDDFHVISDEAGLVY